ncbi:hypothetical protein Bbelb_269070 [Branchiostoma belcheri]|nr:hypothetical protein Bbelb_269070 [Branchiostoma belcheri]
MPGTERDTDRGRRLRRKARFVRGMAVGIMLPRTRTVIPGVRIQKEKTAQAWPPAPPCDTLMYDMHVSGEKTAQAWPPAPPCDILLNDSNANRAKVDKYWLKGIKVRTKVSVVRDHLSMGNVPTGLPGREHNGTAQKALPYGSKAQDHQGTLTMVLTAGR